MKLPPLNGVRTFEVAGRLRNFSKAANELHVTPGAVSRQIRKLEDHLGVDLFVRGSTELSLTEAGRLYLETVQDSLSRLEAGTRAIGAAADARPLLIWGSRFFIRLWLIPRLPDFHTRFPGQEVTIASAMPSDPMPAEFDVAIRLCDKAPPGLNADTLVRRSLTPVCSPAYLAASPPLDAIEDLEHHTLLQTPGGKGDWQKWFNCLRPQNLAMPHEITFTSTDIAYSAALDGLGIVLGRRGFFESDVAKGRLVMPFPEFCDMDDAFLMLYRDRRPVPKRIALFRSWILEQLQPD
ncbi:transcriptional regulator [Agaricicola taiwanensis]|uniref:Transcriptional regulator n=1 Tax=Agaricicola taiwanensis TaxID=591372 RepID=A0A8J3DY53_9RHOB|nr:LysR substrate-binding domain-containing protein [Agaricicola taiwanensis]GGE49235.1 transcriptional regulator [Agaricicola taiwanensis]